MAERVRIILECSMDEERWIQDSLAIRMGSHLIAEAEEHGVDLSAPAHVIITSPGGHDVRRTTLEDLRGGG